MLKSECVKTFDFIESDRTVMQNILEPYKGGTIYFITGLGNVGDNLIYEGTRALLKSLNITYKEISIYMINRSKADVALVCGGGAWCKSYNEYMPKILPHIENRFGNTIILPSSYDTSVERIKSTLDNSNALFMAREVRSYDMAKELGKTMLMHDHAFYFDYSNYMTEGHGNLNAFRTDKERSGDIIPDINTDISASEKQLHSWLSLMSKYDTICTDRAHVMIASAMMGKKVHYRAGNYHKVPEIAKFSLSNFPVYPL